MESSIQTLYKCVDVKFKYVNFITLAASKKVLDMGKCLHFIYFLNIFYNKVLPFKKIKTAYFIFVFCFCVFFLTQPNIWIPNTINKNMVSINEYGEHQKIW